ncbi:hypothetical protein L226DRAFT_566457 [Lentinus tigrinus ALCF2SS1-7]|uniref:Uncharacterized protein n=1 Tax=Lentinus tigrinus ALCF2SS1-6 TaxID=1328759 RepID=A0A5C2SRI8_9APHY|nr:hypothetical protein L227DRAFT_606121 [Lentinus tigrinus ALCF2SS1-6]RPD79908.1 hypothetical protein L226DRAFT_566457 [Lentinus tigrinus ALCF2SS1-7]
MAASHYPVSNLPILTQELYGPVGETIDFEQVSQGGLGVNLGEAYGGITRALINPDSPAFNVEEMGIATKIMLRIQVVECKFYARQVYAIRTTQNADSISLGRLAITIAEEMQKFLDNAGPIQYEERTLTLGNMFLTKLYRVSRGSWQPEIRIRVV